MELACSSVSRSFASLLMSGISAPFFTTMPTGESASSVREPGRVWLAFSSFSSASPTIITTSAFSPRASRFGIACGVLPIEGPGMTTILSPVWRSYSGASFSRAALKPPEIMTFTSCAQALTLRNISTSALAV